MAEIAQTRARITRWLDSWEQAGLGSWTVRLRGSLPVIGYGGCTLLHEKVWNLGYRLAAQEHGHGYATELGREAIRRAGLARPELPVISSLLGHNVASARVATNLGFKLVYRGLDAGNPDPAAVRLVDADRSLADAVLALVVH